MKRILFILLGITLLASTIATGSYGLSKYNTDIYEEALSLQPQVDNIGFIDFNLKDYPVAFFNGENDYVLNWENGDYSISKRKPVLTTFAATIYPVEDHVEILVPTMEQMSTIGSMSKAMSSLDDLDAGEHKSSIETGFGVNEQVSTLWHETFHAYQFTHFEENVEAICAEDINEAVALSEIDNNTTAVNMFKQEAELLEKTLLTEDVDKMREYVIKYKKTDEKRHKLFDISITDLEEYYTRIEGSAQYVGACIFRHQQPEQFAEAYLDNISTYSQGTTKYYNVGMVQCLILDKLDPNWKVGYDFGTSFMELIYEELEI